MKNVGLSFLAFIGLIVVGIAGISIRYCSRALSVAQEEADPRTMLQRYNWFKDAAAMCEKKLADISVYENRFKQLMTDYEGKPRSEWTREDREQYNMWLTESTGIQSSYNLLAAEYNAAMAKVQYRFTNTGDLPRGAEQPLPREFKPYITK